MVLNPENVENRITGSVSIDGRVEAKRQVTAHYPRKNSRYNIIKRDLFKIYVVDNDTDYTNPQQTGTTHNT